MGFQRCAIDADNTGGLQSLSMHFCGDCPSVNGHIQERLQQLAPCTMLFFDLLTIFFKHDCLAPPCLRGGFTISNAAFAKGCKRVNYLKLILLPSAEAS